MMNRILHYAGSQKYAKIIIMRPHSDSKFIGYVYVAVTGRKHTLFRNAIIEKTRLQKLIFIGSLATIVQQL